MRGVSQSEDGAQPAPKTGAGWVCSVAEGLSRLTDAVPFAGVAVVNVLVDSVALLLINFRREDSGQFVQYFPQSGVHIGTGPLFFPPVQNQLGFLESLQQLARRLP